MDVFEYLPQLIVAYDGKDEFANLIHVKKAQKDRDYYCPCCGGIVKPRAIDSNKEQSHYYHQTGKCTKESQLHFFCKHWLFEHGSKFYIDNQLYEVESISIEQCHETSFGKYRPDITVYTTNGTIIFFEIFFTNRKTGDDYFCKWDEIGNDVVEIDIKNYMNKYDLTDIPVFKYLYHNGVCYSKTYEKKDLYANTIAKLKSELTRQKLLNYKSRIEQLDYFWNSIQNNDVKCILESINAMTYDDMVFCYKIVKKKHCISHLKDEILKLINEKVISDTRKTLNLPENDSIYFDLEHIKGRTYKIGIRLKLETDHISYNRVFSYKYEGDYTNNLSYFQKNIVFETNIFDKKNIVIDESDVEYLKELYVYVSEVMKLLLNYEEEISHFEQDLYKIKMNNNNFTVLVNNSGKYELLFENLFIKGFSIDNLIKKIEEQLLYKQNNEFLNVLFASNTYKKFLFDIEDDKFDIQIDITNKGKNITFDLYMFLKRIYHTELETSIESLEYHIEKCKKLISEKKESFSDVFELIENINCCKNKIWKAKLGYNYYYNYIIVDQRIFKPRSGSTKYYIYFDISSIDIKILKQKLQAAMNNILNDIEFYGYRVMEECE